MALTDAQWAAEVADIVAAMIAETITAEEAAAQLAAATGDWTVSASAILELAQRVSRFLAKLNGLVVMEGAPDPGVGELNTWYFDRLTGDFYGPKTAAGWGDSSFSLVGPPGPAGPKGDTGDTGAVGPKGDTGDTGPKGDTGDTGPKGDQGDIGPKGDTGDQGIQGNVGPKGDTGDVGPKGDTGDTGATGPKGDKGDRGDAFAVNAQGDLAGRAAYDGEPVGFSYLDEENGNLYFRIAAGGWSTPIPFGKGDKGDDGDLGASAYAVAVANGFVGTEAAWLASLVGAKGDDGDQGPAGANGADGADGSNATVTGAAISAALGFTPADPASVPTKATGAELRAGTNDAKFGTAKGMADAVAVVTITPTTAAAGMDFSGFINAEITLTANLTVGAPSGGFARKTGEIDIVQDATGGRTLAFHANYIVPANFALQATANGRTSIPYRYQADGKVRLYNPSKWVA